MLHKPTSSRLRHLALLLFLIASVTRLTARDFTYQGINYTVLSEEDKTVKTKAGTMKGIANPIRYSGNEYEGDLILPSIVSDGTNNYKLTRIGYCSFCKNKNLKSVVIPNTVTIIDHYAFEECSSLTSVNIPSYVTEIGNSAFLGCSLTSVDIPNSVTTINDYAFKNNPKLSIVKIMGSPIIEPNTFYGDIIDKLYFFKRVVLKTDINGSALDGLNVKSNIYCSYSDVAYIKSHFKGNVYPYDLPIIPVISDIFQVGVKITPEVNPYFEGDATNFTLIGEIYDANNNKITSSNISFTEPTLIKGLLPKTEYTIKYIFKNSNGEILFEQSETITTKDISVELSTQTTQTTAKLTVTTEPDETVNISKTIVNINPYYSGEGTDYTYSGKPITLKDLYTNWSYKVKVKLYGKINGEQEEKLIQTSEFTFYTKKINVEIQLRSIDDITPTTVKLKAVVNAGDAKIKEAYWKGGETDREIVMTGLEPGTWNTFVFYVYPENGELVSDSRTVVAKALELTMLDPKSVSPTSAILAAQTNISDNEPNVGFQWKKYDAPASLKPSEGYGAVYDGILEGQLKNLQSTSYYNARAFYKDGKDNYYYSDWVTFDPSDFSYFQPTAHTYPVEKITTAYVSIKGYVMPGSEPIISQGFQYWVNGSANKMQAFAPSADKIMTVTGTGQVMTANLTDLQSNTEYTVRTFVQTESGTVYGEEQIFTTLENMSVSDISVDDAEVEIVGYYDLMGRRYDRPRKGLNIVVYSDGTTRKVIER